MKILRGRTPRQSRYRLYGAVAFAIAASLVGLSVHDGSLEENPALARLYPPTFAIVLLIWAIFVVMDLREGLRHIADRQGNP